MFQYIIRKIIYGFLVLFGVVTIIFVLFNIKPGDPSLMLGGQNATDEVIENIRKAIKQKPEKHSFAYDFSNEQIEGKMNRHMSLTGG